MDAAGDEGNATTKSLCANLTALLSDVKKRGRYFDDSANSYKYIVFILIIYGVSFLSLMVKYFWSGKARHHDELYDQFVKRDELTERKLLVANTMTKTAFAAAAQQVPMAAIAITRSQNLSAKETKPLENSPTTTTANSEENQDDTSVIKILGDADSPEVVVVERV